MAATPAPTANGPAFVTGGSSGIGFAIAAELAGKSHDLALIARDAARLEDAQRKLLARFPGRRIEIFAADVGDRAACEAAVEKASAALGAPAWAVANAGIAVPGEFLAQPIEEHEAQMRANYMGSLYFAKAAAGKMAGRGGRLVFVSSGAAFFGIHGYSAYAPSKFAVRGLAEVLRVELAPHGILVSVAYPPDTDTPQLVAEAKTKPAATKEITAGGGLWSAEAVAKKIVGAAERGKFVVAPGLQMAALNSLHSLIAPALRWWQGTIVRKHSKPGDAGKS